MQPSLSTRQPAPYLAVALFALFALFLLMAVLRPIRPDSPSVPQPNPQVEDIAIDLGDPRLDPYRAALTPVNRVALGLTLLPLPNAGPARLLTTTQADGQTDVFLEIQTGTSSHSISFRMQDGIPKWANESVFLNGPGRCWQSGDGWTEYALLEISAYPGPDGTIVSRVELCAEQPPASLAVPRRRGNSTTWFDLQPADVAPIIAEWLRVPAL